MRTRKWVLVFAVLSLALALLAVYTVRRADQTFKELFRDKYVECDPNVLLPQIEEVIGCRFPARIFEVRSARTYGTWDSNSSFCTVMFAGDANSVDTFLMSVPRMSELRPYNRQKDIRRAYTRNGAPAWFAEPILLGKMADFDNGELFIDTVPGERQRVYVLGFGGLPLPEVPVTDTNTTPGRTLNHH